MAQVFPGISLLFAFNLPLQKYLFVKRQRLWGVITLLLVLMITEGHMSLKGNAQPGNYIYYLLTGLLLFPHFAVQVRL